jgi:hypothetical protein
MGSAKFAIEASPSTDRGYDAADGATLTLTLEDVDADITRAVFSIVIVSEDAVDDLPTFTPSDGRPSPTVASSVDIVLPTLASARGSAFWIRCQVNEGQNADGTVNPEYTKDRIIVVRSGGVRPPLPGETTEYKAIYGWTTEIGVGGGGGGGTEAPTVSTIPQRTSAGVIRSVGYTLETDTDASRTIKGLRADATTRDEITIDATVVRISGGVGQNRLLVTPDLDGNPLGIDALQSDGLTSEDVLVGLSALTVDGASTIRFQTSGDRIDRAATHAETSAASAYGRTYTPAAAATEVYANDVTSVTSRIAQAASGAGKSRYILGGLGASGSANGVFVSGLENGNTVLGGANWASVGSLVANVSDPFSVGYGTPGSLTSILDIYQQSAGYTRIRGPAQTEFFSIGALLLSSNSSIAITSSSDITVSADVWYRRSAAGSYLRRTHIGSFGPISSATTTTVLSFTTLSARIYDVVATVVVTNDTDNEGATYFLRAAFKNIAGTVTQIGATQTIAADLEDAGQTGLSCTLDFSGTAIRVRLTTDSTDTVNGTYIVDITERIQA